MNFKQHNTNKTSFFATIESHNSSTTKEPINYRTSSPIIENPFERLNMELNEIKAMIMTLLETHDKPVETLDLIDLKETCKFLNLSPSAIYKMTAKNTIPTIRRVGSKKLIFSRSELDNWLRKSESSSNSNIRKVNESLHENSRVCNL